jgi:hypothetical protein
MKQRLLHLLNIFSRPVFLSAAILSIPLFTFGQSYSTGLTFGRPLTSSKYSCAGGGVCVERVADPTNQDSWDPGMIGVTFYLLQSDPTTLVMTFSMNDLQNNQPNEVPLFTNAAGTYQFDTTYTLNSPGFQSLNMLPNPRISQTSPTAVTIDGDVVTVYIKYDYDQQQ